jgi:hypothetical protein
MYNLFTFQQFHTFLSELELNEQHFILKLLTINNADLTAE